MTHGRIAKTRLNRRRKKRARTFTGVPEKPKNSLEARVTRLEIRVEELQREIDRASGAMPTHILEALSGSGQHHPGPREKMDETELLHNRDNLVDWLEKYWPKIVNSLLAAKYPRDVARAFSQVVAEQDSRQEWQNRFLAYPADLLDFLKSEKFRVKPPRKTVADALNHLGTEKRPLAANRLPTRQIANAMAGVPKLKWRTSLDKCSKSPSSFRVGYNTATHYRKVFSISEG
jgi:hypothetical protein